MLLTNSMRYRLIIVLLLVVVMLSLFTGASAAGINSYRRTIDDLELSISNIPRRSSLIATVTILLSPLRVDLPNGNVPLQTELRALQVWDARFTTVLKTVRTRVRDFQVRWHSLPDNLRPGHAEESAYLTLFQTINRELDSLEHEQSLLFDEAEQRDRFIRDISKSVAGLTDSIEQLPDPSNRLGERLRDAKDEYRFHYQLVIAFGLISLILFATLVVLTVKWILLPIQKLHEGVLQIASGDYSYRLNLTTACELSYMATTFNEMAAKIEQDQCDKEREIQERSRQLVLSERMAGIGFLASGVAHEINNPLSVIMNATNGVERRLGGDVLQHMPEKNRGKIFDYLQLIQSESERCEAITKKLLAFSYGSADERNRYDVVAVCREVAAMVSHLGKYRRKTVRVNRADPLHAWVNAPEIKQVVLNLVANGLDASNEGDEVLVEVRELPDQVEIAVSDKGCGMTPEQRSQIFEPFFTTKEVGKGTGLGLSITHRIVVDHEGTLEVESDGPGQGSTFRLRLPKSAKVVRAA